MAKSKASNSVLIGIIADVSGSMREAIGTSGTDAVNRLEAFSEALKQTVARAADSIRDAARERPDLKARLFAYGFGFGNPVAQFMMGDRGPPVRDLFAPDGVGERTIDVEELADNWERYYENVRSMALRMFGATPMRQAFEVGRRRLAAERSSKAETCVLFVLSDGAPTDGDAADIVPIAEAIRRDGTTIVSCYVTGADITEARHLYGRAQDHWPPAARLMFDCASELPADTPFGDHFREHDWRIDPEAKLFAQVNQSQTLGEFLDVVLSPLKEPSAPEAAAVPAAAGRPEPSAPRPAREAAPAAPPPETEAAERKALLLFVHGLGGHPRAAWGQLPDFLIADPAVAAGFDVDFYSFPTSIFRLPFGSRAPKIQELAAGLRTFIEYSGYQRVSLICHSLGGLIARRYLIEEVKNNRPLRVDHLALFAVPNNGAGLASVGEYVSWRHPQIRQLCKDADLIEFLSEDWFTFRVQEKLRMKFILGTQDRVVDRFSVAGYWGNPDTETVVGRGHVDLIKPDDADDLVVRIVKKLIQS